MQRRRPTQAARHVDAPKPKFLEALRRCHAAYDLDAPDSEWLPEILHAGLPFLDFGLGVAGAICSQSIDRSTTIIHGLHATGGLHASQEETTDLTPDTLNVREI